MNTKNGETTGKDRYALFRHAYFYYLSYYLIKFFIMHRIKKQAVIEDAGFGGKTLTHLLAGKDMSLNCYLRLLTTMKGFCADDEEYVDFITGFIKRAIIEVWRMWGLEPQGWMRETWREMQEEKVKYNAARELIVQGNFSTFTGVKK